MDYGGPERSSWTKWLSPPHGQRPDDMPILAYIASCRGRADVTVRRRCACPRTAQFLAHGRDGAAYYKREHLRMLFPDLCFMVKLEHVVL